MTQLKQSRESVVTDLPPSGSEPMAEVFDCWNTIGVGGNGSCGELLRYTHCRNCPVHAAAAAKLLDRPLHPQWRAEWTEHYAREKKLTTPVRTSVVIFRLGPEWLALPTAAFQEVAERRVTHTLPGQRPRLVLGLVNIRGELLISVSLGRLLGLEATPRPAAGLAWNPSPLSTPRSSTATEDGRRAAADGQARLLVTLWAGQRLVLPVDEVHGIRRVPQDELRAPPATVALSGRSCLLGLFPWRDHTVGLLAAEELFATLNRQLT